MKKNYVIAVDLGGTKISCALADINGEILNHYTIPTNTVAGDQGVLNRIIWAIEKVLEDGQKSKDEIRAIGIGSPGPLDSENGIILEPANLPFRNFQLVKPIVEKFNIPTYLENDANAAAIGEYMFGAGKGTKNMIYITVSTGVGSGAIINGRIYRGNTCNALEIGHTTLLPDGPRCGCGNYGCLEAVASGTAIGRMAREALESGVDSTLINYNKVSSYEVFKEAETGDKLSNDVIDKCLGYLGIGVANVITTFDPEMVVIGGGVSMAGNRVFDKIDEVVKKRCYKVLADNCRIVPAALGTQSGIVGAAALAIMESKNNKL